MKNKSTIIIAAGFIAISIVIIGKFIINRKPADNNKNPYELNIDSISKIADKDICWKEIKKIPINFGCPHGIAIGPDDAIWVSGDSLLLEIDLNNQEKARINTTETGTAIAVSNENLLYVAMENHVEVFSVEGVLINKWNAVEDNSEITSLALRSNTILVADAENGFVYEHNKEGKLLHRFGSKDTTDEIRKFIIPSYYFDVAVDNKNNLWVVNPGKHLLVCFNDDGSVKNTFGKFSASLDGFCGCCNPTHIAIMKDNTFITAEKGIVRVKQYSSSGEFMCAVAGPDLFSENSKGLDIAIDSKGILYVLEPQNKVIHVFQHK